MDDSAAVTPGLTVEYMPSAGFRDPKTQHSASDLFVGGLDGIDLQENSLSSWLYGGV